MMNTTLYSLIVDEKLLKSLKESDLFVASYENGKHLLTFGNPKKKTHKVEIGGTVLGEIEGQEEQLCVYILSGYESDILKLLKAGDSIRLVWLVNDPSMGMSKHGLIHQTLFLSVHRTDEKSVEQMLTLKIGEIIGKPDFLMCRGYKLNSLS